MADLDLVVRPYTSADYESVKAMLDHEYRFDEATDSQERIDTQIQRDPNSIFVTEQSGRITGTASIMEDGRMAYIFKWLGTTEVGIRSALKRAEDELIERGYSSWDVFVSAHYPIIGEAFDSLGYSGIQDLIRMRKHHEPNLPNQARK